MKRLFAILGIAVGLATPAYASFVVTPDGNAADQTTTAAIVGNDFQADLINLGLTNASYGAALSLDAPGTVTFYAFGSESLFDDSFVKNGTQLFAETDPTATYYGGAPGTDGLNLGSFAYAAGSIADLLFHVVTPHGPGTPIDAAVGDHGFSIFYGSNPTGLLAFGFDDNGASPEDNHDDLVILARITAVPEPATWLLMIAGFGFLALAYRRTVAPART
jgi:PEP-CTERM motif